MPSNITPIGNLGEDPVRPETSPDVGATKRWVDTYDMKNRVIGSNLPEIKASGEGAFKTIQDNSNTAKQVGVAHDSEGIADVLGGRDPNK